MGTVAAVLIGHALLIFMNLSMDGDTLRLDAQLSTTGSFRAACSLLGAKTVLYPVQPPLLWASAAAGRSAVSWWNPISASRLWTILALGAIAWLLSRLARDAGAGPGGRAAAVLLPFCWHGFSFLAITCDDNVVTDALRLAVVWTTVRWLSAPAGGRGWIAAGVALGAAMGWHFQSVLLFPGIAIAGSWSVRGDGRRRLRETAAVLAVGAAIWAGLSAFDLAMGTDLAPPLRALAGATVENHRDARLWAPAGLRGLAAQGAVVGEGWCRMVLGYPWLRPPRAGIATAGVVASAGFLLAVMWWGLRGSVLGRVLAAFLAVQCAHSLLYESESIERWDFPVLVAGLILAAGLVRLRATRRAADAMSLETGCWALATALVMCNLVGYGRFVRDSEPAFLDVVEGRRKIDPLGLDCVGAHARLCAAAREFSRLIGPTDGPIGVIERKVPDVFHQHYATSWLTAYMICYSPQLAAGAGTRPLWICLFSPPPSPFRIVKQEGFAWLAERGR